MFLKKVFVINKTVAVSPVQEHSRICCMKCHKTGLKLQLPTVTYTFPQLNRRLLVSLVCGGGKEIRFITHRTDLLSSHKFCGCGTSLPMLAAAYSHKLTP